MKRPETRKQDRKYAVRRMILAVLCMIALSAAAVPAAADVQITVVEDIPAAEIEESEVPLAALPGTAAERGGQHALWAGILLAAVVAYVVYFSRYDRRLFRLRQEAARTEQMRMAALRGETAEVRNER